jgi:hypothetical protein
MILTILLIYFSGMAATIGLALAQRKLIRSGKATIVPVRDFVIRNGSLYTYRSRRVENGIWTFDWLPSDFMRMSFLSWLFWLLLGLTWIYFTINEHIDKIDEDEK